MDDTPTFAHVGFVEAYAVGPRAIQRVEDSRVAFTIFLQEGYRYQTEGKPPSRVALEAIITTIFEIVYLQTRASATPQAARLLPHIIHMCLTPFMGPAAANEFIEAKLAETPRPAAVARETAGCAGTQTSLDGALVGSMRCWRGTPSIRRAAGRARAERAGGANVTEVTGGEPR